MAITRRGRKRIGPGLYVNFGKDGLPTSRTQKTGNYTLTQNNKGEVRRTIRLAKNVADVRVERPTKPKKAKFWKAPRSKKSKPDRTRRSKKSQVNPGLFWAALLFLIIYYAIH